MNKQRRQALRKHLHQYLETISDDKQRLVCFYFMKGASDDDICREIKISHERLELIRMTLAIEMRNFGIAPEDWRNEEERTNA